MKRLAFSGTWELRAPQPWKNRARQEGRTATDIENLLERAFLPARVVAESSTLSEFVARGLRAAGFEVLVAGPNFAPMYASRSKKIKTDKRDARTLAAASLRGT